MRVKSIVITLLILAAVLAVYAIPCYAAEITVPNVNQLFDMSPSAWTTSTYPAFMDTASGTYLYNAPSMTLPTISTSGLGKISSISYSPIFDMSPGAFSLSTYPAFTDSGQLTNMESSLGAPMIPYTG